MWHAGDWCVCVHVCVCVCVRLDFLAFHPYMFFHFFKMFFVTCFSCFFGGWIVVAAQLQLAATYIDDSHTVQMYNYSSKGPHRQLQCKTGKDEYTAPKARQILTLFNAHHQG